MSNSPKHSLDRERRATCVLASSKSTGYKAVFQDDRGEIHYLQSDALPGQRGKVVYRTTPASGLWYFMKDQNV